MTELLKEALGSSKAVQALLKNKYICVLVSMSPHCVPGAQGKGKM